MSWRRGVGLGLCVGLVGVNFLAAMHARAFLFFGPPGERSSSVESISVVEAASVLVLGPSLPRPENRTDPHAALGRSFASSEHVTADGETLALWTLEPRRTARGTVVLLHGYGGSRDQLLDVADFFLAQGYRTVLPDQRAAGDSTGAYTTLGYKEAEDLAGLAVSLRQTHTGPLVVYGFSMGAVAALGAVGREGAPVDAVIAEAPYGSLVDTVGQRFRLLGLPPTPGSELLLVWGSVWTGFWAFDLRPVEDAAHISVPTLVISGAHDRRAPPADGAAIAARLMGPSEHLVLPETGHQVGLWTRPVEWGRAVKQVLSRL